MASLMNQWPEWFKAGILYMRYLRHRVRAMVLIDTHPCARMPIATDAAVLFGTLGAPPSGRWRPLSPQAWTCVGVLAIPLWATWPTLALRTLEMPAFECLTIAFLFGWIVLGRAEQAAAQVDDAQRAWRSWIPALACAAGLSGSNAFHILATHYIPAAEANLISYLWPVMIVGFGALLGLFRLRPRQLAGLVLGFAGIAILMRGGAISLSPLGLGLALLSGLSWALYCIFRLRWKPESGPLLARGCAISTLLCAGLHLLLEPTVVPSIGAIAAAAAVGIVPLAAGNLAWDQGFRRGDGQLLAVLAYATPLCSALLLALLGLELFSWGLLIGAIVIVLAGLLSRADARQAQS
jgi:drug/metabolite transporter (DMT)-like permease